MRTFVKAGLGLLALAASATPLHAQGADPAAAKTRLDAMLDREMPGLIATYRDLHAHPELAMQEQRTAAILSARLKKLGYTVTEKVGGTGVVAVLRNGEGPTVLVRADMDALPMAEKTGLPFASQVPGVMHACGHDVHITWLIGVAQGLVTLKDQWQGTVVLMGQPAEEGLGGARAMLDDGLLTRFPRPDYGLAAHITNLPTGSVFIKEGASSSASDSYAITFHGRGAHGSMPSESIDPVVMGARFVTDVQTIISRERDAGTFGVLTVGAFQAGTEPNIIPDEALVKVNLRSNDEATRNLLKDGMARTARAVATMARASEPTIAYMGGTGAVINEPALARQTYALLKPLLGQGVISIPASIPPTSGSEDWSEVVNAGVPSLYLGIGGYDPKVIAQLKAAGKAVPVNHSPLFAPDAEGAIRTATQALVLSIVGGVRPAPKP